MGEVGGELKRRVPLYPTPIQTHFNSIWLKGFNYKEKSKQRRRRKRLK